jgi:multidrug transporter EmrE-like cation transporter
MRPVLYLLLCLFSSTAALVPWRTPRLPHTSARIDVAQAARRVKRGGALQATPVGAGGGGGRALLALTIALEVFATTSMKLASTRPIWHLGTVVGYGSCFSVFPLVLRKMPLGVAYAIWSGVGTALTALIGAALFGEALSTQKVGALAVIVAGVVLLELAH